MNRTPTDETPQSPDPQSHFEDSLILLTSLRDALAALVLDLRNGRLNAIPDIATKQLELEIALKHAFEMERTFNEWQQKENGEPAADAVDLDSVRNEIGCRLARLRACCRSD
ncbi:hypothetical protein [Flavimaricola marinus]|uniref:hypothetical protein n=1 Tax=Flavimaricola marinus TaxID=1819565 RepID=UPI0010562717|nr:hypothetical protein [Flavimaricola marinus]